MIDHFRHTNRFTLLKTATNSARQTYLWSDTAFGNINQNCAMLGSDSVPTVAAVYDRVNELQSGDIPLLAKEGWPRHQEDGPVPTSRGRGGRS